MNAAATFTTRRQSDCRYCVRYDRACGREHTTATAGDWARDQAGNAAAPSVADLLALDEDAAVSVRYVSVSTGKPAAANGVIVSAPQPCDCGKRDAFNVLTPAGCMWYVCTARISIPA